MSVKLGKPVKKIAFLLSVALTSPAWSQDQSGFYIGGDISSFDTEFENLTATGDGTALGIHAGYRYVFDNSVFVEGEFVAATLNGETNTGNTDFENYYGLTVGVGAYFSSNLYGMAFGGFANVNTENATAGSQSDDGTILGVGVGYDFTPQHSLGLRYSRISVDGDFGDVDTDILGVRYSYSF